LYRYVISYARIILEVLLRFCLRFYFVDRYADDATHFKPFSIWQRLNSQHKVRYDPFWLGTMNIRIRLIFLQR